MAKKKVFQNPRRRGVSPVKLILLVAILGGGYVAIMRPDLMPAQLRDLSATQYLRDIRGYFTPKVTKGADVAKPGETGYRADDRAELNELMDKGAK